MRAGRLLVLLSILVAALFSCFKLSEYDVCWHLRAGEWILANGQVPRADPFSHSVAGKPWIDFEWLAQAAFYTLTVLGGLDALILFKMGVTALAFLLVALTCRRQGVPSLVSAGMLLLTALAAHERFFSRPDMFTNLGVAWTVFAFEGLGRGQRRWALPLVVGQALWTNLHGGFLMGPLIGIAFAAGTFLNHLLRSPSRDAQVPPAPRATAAWTLAITAAAALACLVNPYGWRLAVYPFTEIPLNPLEHHRSIFLETIAEWQSPFSAGEFGHPMLMAFYAWTALWGLALLLRFRYVDFRGVCLALGTFALAASARRHVAIFAIATAPFLARELWMAGRTASGRGLLAPLAGALAYVAWVLWVTCGGPHPVFVLATLLLPAGMLAWPLLRAMGSLPLRAALVLGIFFLQADWAMALASDRFNGVYGNGRIFGFGADASHYPEGAVRYMERRRIHGRLFNNLAAGGYLVWRAPQYPVFIDGRNLLYGEEFYRTYMQALSSEAEWKVLCDTYGLTVALVAQGEALGNFVDRMTLESPDWRLVYADHLSRLFIRQLPETQAMLASLPPGIATCLLSRVSVGPPGRLPARLACAVQRLLGPAQGWETKESMARAELLRIQGDVIGASRTYAEILEREPGNAQAAAALAGLYERMEMLSAAEALYRRLLAGQADGRIRSGVHALLGTVLMKEGRHEEARKEYAQASPTDPGPSNNLGIEALEAGDPGKALGCFERAVRLDSSEAGLWCNLASAQEALGRKDEALQSLLKALELSPRHVSAGPRLVRIYADRLRSSPESASTANDLGAVYHHMGNLQAAESWYREALRLNPGMSGVRRNLAVLACDREDAPGVEAWLEEIAKRHETPPARALAWAEGRRKPAR